MVAFVTSPLVYGSVFTGIGGLDRGFDNAGWKCAFQVEIDKWATKVLANRWPDTLRFTDVREVDRERIESNHVGQLDALVGGFPCQDISLAGRRAGLAGNRSGLFFEFMRLAQELAPRWLLIENVPGLLSSGGRRDMGAVLGEMGNCGYGVTYRVLDAQYFGLAQRRKRLFLVGHLGAPWSASAEVLLEPESSHRDSPPSREERARPSDRIAHGTRDDGSAARRHRADGVVGSLKANYGSVGVDDNTAQAGHLVTEYEVPDVSGTLGGGAQLRGWSDDLDRSGAFPVVAPDVAATLTSSSNPNSNMAGRSKSDDANLIVTTTHEVSPCLQERGYKGADSDMTQAYVMIDPTAAQSLAENQRGELRLGDIANQLSCEGGKPGQGYPAVLDERGKWSVHNGDSVAYAEDSTLTITGSKGNPGTVNDVLNDVGMVRRLTPLECERLQGFPDGWTDGLSDSRRYKALGNAVAVPVAEWLATRIANVDATT